MVNVTNLAEEIQQSTISIALDHISVAGDAVYILFKDVLSNEDQSTLLTVIAQHNAIPTAEIQVVKVSEDDNINQLSGRFCSESIQFNTSVVGDWNITDKVWPMNISALTYEMHLGDLYVGDEMDMIVAPNTQIGVLAAPIAPDDTTVFLSTTPMAWTKMNVGFNVTISDGVNTDEMGRVLAIDRALGTLTMETPAVHAFAASTTPVLISIYVNRGFKFFGNANRLVVGDGKIGGSFVPKNTVVRIRYKNNTGPADKAVGLYVDYLY